MKVESKEEAENKIKEKPKLSIKDMTVKLRMTYILESLKGIGQLHDILRDLSDQIEA